MGLDIKYFLQEMFWAFLDEPPSAAFGVYKHNSDMNVNQNKSMERYF